MTASRWVQNFRLPMTKLQLRFVITFAFAFLLLYIAFLIRTPIFAPLRPWDIIAVLTCSVLFLALETALIFRCKKHFQILLHTILISIFAVSFSWSLAKELRFEKT